jgi:D-alanyl-D-alanine-carboxypeptidase/D-alanyl-D-alanine-endopeptidase
MKKYLTIAFLIVTTNTVFGQIPADSIKAIIKQEVAGKRSKSIIVGIIDANGRQIFAEGKLSDKDPVLPDGNTIYEIGSITKVFTSLLLVDMSLKHQLELSDPISKYLPKTVKTPVRNGKEISLLSLSTNMSGLPRNASNIDPKDLDNPFADYTAKQLYEFISNVALSRDIDSKWQYSNIGYSLLGDILAIVGHKDFETLVNEDICAPLNMKNTFFSPPPKLKNKIAQGYSECGQPASAWDFPLAGGGGLRSNVNDMLSFAAANLGFIETGLLPAMELTHMPQARKEGNTGYYTTMGWTLWDDDGRQLVFKDGGTGGYRTFLGIDKKNKFGVVVLSNSNNSVTDIGLHMLDSTYKIPPYQYPWSLLDTLRAKVKNNGVDAAIELYQRLKASKNTSFIFNENQLNHLGNELRRNKKIKEAIKIYELNIKEYPKSTLAYESLGETYKRNGNKKTAIQYFEKARELDPQNPHWAYILGKLKQASQ